MNRNGPLANGRSMTVRAGIASSKDDHAFAVSRYLFLANYRVACCSPILLREIFHSKMNAVQFAARNRQITSLRCPATENQPIKVPAQFLHRQVHAHVGIGLKNNSLFGHEV